ncbi:hypothetical protein CBS101457_005153 [Exobasidium rhododendri]|nr:hypothetical protein CBS101457_005153 [Exobasidium rhododendri]
MLSSLSCMLFLVLATLAVVRAALFPPKTPVLEMTQANFKSEVLSIEKPTIVMFSAPWCGHCKNLAPHFHKAASNLDGIVKFGNIDCDQDSNKGLCAEYGIKGFPTIKLFPATKKRLAREYRGERTAKALIEYAKETLPMGARKLVAEELEKYVNDDASRPKVILFSNKPKSSPLYRSLALDFRSSMDFAFMRGDESLVRSSARLSLGVDIPTEKDLPVLVMVPSRSASDGGEVPEIEKGKFETYTGPLKYWKIKDWLDEVGPKVGAGKSKTAKKSPTKSPKKKQAPTSAKINHTGEKLPEGGSVEWKAQKPKDQGRNMVKEAIQAREEAERLAAEAPDAPVMDESKPKKDSFKGQMLDIERAGEIADEIREKQKAAARKQGKVDKKDDGLLGKAKAAVGSVVDTAAQAVKDASESINEQLEAVKVGETVDIASQKVFGSGKPFEKKSAALMKQFEKWMSGEQDGWQEGLGEQFEKAQAEAEQLLKSNPEEAKKQAWQSEEWLLKEMRADRDKMMNVMTAQQRAQVDNMIELIEDRLKDKDNRDVFEKVLDEVVGSKEENKKTKGHDEL